jgi:hypothetical protein
MPGHTGPLSATITAARWHVRPLPAPSSHATDFAYKRGVTDSKQEVRDKLAALRAETSRPARSRPSANDEPGGRERAATCQRDVHARLPMILACGYRVVLPNCMLLGMTLAGRCAGLIRTESIYVNVARRATAFYMPAGRPGSGRPGSTRPLPTQQRNIFARPRRAPSELPTCQPAAKDGQNLCGTPHSRPCELPPSSRRGSPGMPRVRSAMSPGSSGKPWRNTSPGMKARTPSDERSPAPATTNTVVRLERGPGYASQDANRLAAEGRSRWPKS